MLFETAKNNLMSNYKFSWNKREENLNKEIGHKDELNII